MTEAATVAPDPWADAAAAAALFAVAPRSIGGVVLRAHAGPVRDQWLTLLRDLLPEDAPLRRIPLHVSDSRLLGGLDLPATLQAGRPVAERGLLAEADQGVVILAMAERVSPSTAARLAAVMDSSEVVMQRDGVALRSPASIGVVALDESASAEESPPAALLDRLAVVLDLRGVRAAETSATPPPYSAGQVAAARAIWPLVTSSDTLIEALCSTALALGIASLRAPLLALQLTRAAAALAGRAEATQEDAVLAARLVFAPRATALPATEAPSEDAPGEPDGQDQSAPDAPADAPQHAASDTSPPDPAEPDPNTQPEPDQVLAETILAAAAASIPAGLLSSIKQAGGDLGRARSAGRAGAMQQGARRGRPAGIRRGEPRAGARLNVLATLRAAAPWQRLRQPNAVARNPNSPRARVQVRREDFHVTRYRQRAETTTIFAVDASGSSALHRLAEAKGAVELLLADCYVRRDRVAVIAFRGSGAEILLPPTRSLVRAKRSLAGLPGGGGTPLAAGIDAAVLLGQSVMRGGCTPLLVLLTDGRANVSRAGTGGRAQAMEEAMAAARALRAAGLSALLVDTSPQPQPGAQRLAQAMNASYVPLPYAGASDLTSAVKAAALLH